MPRYLDPKSDVVFKKIFGEHPHLLIHFLNALLPLPEDGLIKSIEYLPAEQIPVIPILKNTFVDVKCLDHQGRIFIVEMQIQWIDSFMQRMLYGTSKAYVKQLEKGEQYEYLNPVYGLGLLASIFDKESDDWYHHYKIINVQKPERELKGLQMVFIELPKFKATTFNQKKVRALWLRFMNEVNENSREIEPMLFEVPEIKEALSLSEEAGYTPAELETYDQYWDAVRVQKSLISGSYSIGEEVGLKRGFQKGEEIGFQKGEESGLQKGRQNEKIMMAKKMLIAGKSLQEINKFTELSLEELRFINEQIELTIENKPESVS